MEASKSGESNSYFTKEFFSRILHHSRSPYNGLLGFSELLLLNKGRIKDEDYTDYLLRVNMLAKKAFLFSENLILFLKLSSESETIDPVMGPVSFSSVFDQSLNLCKEAFQLKKSELKTDIGHNLLLNADSRLLQQMLANLLAKAAKHCNDGSPVEVRACNQDGLCIIEVHYNGMEPESKSVIEFFTHTSTETTLFQPEADIELWNCYQLCALQSMELSMELINDSGIIFRIVSKG